MKALITIAILVAAGFGGWQIYSYWTNTQAKEAKTQAAVSQVMGTDLPGMVSTLESQLQASQQQGSAGLKGFLTRYGKTISDPRLAWIELDYVVLVAREDPAEAKRVFARVKKRTPNTSPVYPRVKQLEKTYD